MFSLLFVLRFLQHYIQFSFMRGIFVHLYLIILSVHCWLISERWWIAHNKRVHIFVLISEFRIHKSHRNINTWELQEFHKESIGVSFSKWRCLLSFKSPSVSLSALQCSEDAEIKSQTESLTYWVNDKVTPWAVRTAKILQLKVLMYCWLLSLYSRSSYPAYFEHAFIRTKFKCRL